MNSEANKLVEKRKAEIKALGGEDAYRLLALHNLRLKTVVKESHGSPVHSLVFNHVAEDCSNLFATVGGDQATIYDDEHMGDHISIAVHFSNQKTEYVNGGDLHVCCWINSANWSSHSHGDACLAVSGADPAISIISVVESRVIKLLRGHTKEVIDISSIPSSPNLLVSLSKDGNIRLWDVPSETCISSINTDATCIALSSDVTSIITGTSRGRLYMYDLEIKKEGTVSIVESSKSELQQGQNSHVEGIDCIKCVPGDRLISKSSDGRMFVWQLPEMECTAALKVPGSNSMGGLSSRCLFQVTPDGKYISVVRVIHQHSSND